MKQYALIVWQPDGEPPAPEVLARIGEDLEQFHRELHEAGAWVFAGGLHDAATATVVRPQGDDTLLTDGPFTEGKEHVGGLCIIRAADLDAALEWGRKAARASTLPIEVRPFHGEAGD